MPKIPDITHPNPDAAYPDAVSLSQLAFRATIDQQKSAHIVYYDTYSLDEIAQEESKKYKPWVKKLNKFSGPRGEDASIFEVLFNSVANLFIKNGLAPSAKIIVNSAGKVHGIASEHIATQIEKTLETKSDCRVLCIPKDWKGKSSWKNNTWDFPSIPQQHDVTMLTQAIAQDMRRIHAEYENIEFTDDDITQAIETIEKSDPNPLGKIFLRRYKLQELSKGIHFLNEFPAGFFAHLREAEAEGILTFDTASLVASLSAPYIFEDDDSHKGNIGFYIIEEPPMFQDTLTKSKKTVIFFKIDFDLMFTRSIMATLNLRIANIALSGDANAITTYDLEHFPDIKDANLHYWPTQTRYFATGDKQYRKPDTEAFRSLHTDLAFKREKWKCFFKHAVMPINLVDAHLRLHISDTVGFDKIIRVKDAVSERLHQLRKALLSSKEFLLYYQSINKTSSPQALKDEILKEIADCIDPRIPENTKEKALEEAINAFDNICLILDNQLIAKKHPKKRDQVVIVNPVLSKEKQDDGLSEADDDQDKDDLPPSEEIPLMATSEHPSIDDASSPEAFIVEQHMFPKLGDQHSSSQINIQEVSIKKDSDENSPLAEAEEDDDEEENFSDTNKPNPLRETVFLKSTLLQQRTADKKLESNTNFTALQTIFSGLQKCKKVSRITRSIFLDFYPFYASGDIRKRPSQQDIFLATEIFQNYLRKHDLKNAFKYACIVSDLIKHSKSGKHATTLQNIKCFKRSYFGFVVDEPGTNRYLDDEKQLDPIITISLEKFHDCAQKIQESDLPLKQKKLEVVALLELVDFPLADLEKLKFELSKLEPESLVLKFINQLDHQHWCLKKFYGSYGITTTNKKLHSLLDTKIASHLKANNQLMQAFHKFNNGTYFFSLEFFERLKNDPRTFKEKLITIHKQCTSRIGEIEQHVKYLKQIRDYHKAVSEGMIENRKSDSNAKLNKKEINAHKKEINAHKTQATHTLTALKKTIQNYEEQLKECKCLANLIHPEQDPYNIYKTIETFEKNPHQTIKPHCPAENILLIQPSVCAYNEQNGKYEASSEELVRQNASVMQAQLDMTQALQKPTEIVDETTLSAKAPFSITSPAYQINTTSQPEVDYLKYDIYFKKPIQFSKCCSQPPAKEPVEPPKASFIECRSNAKTPYKIIIDHFPQEEDFVMYADQKQRKKALEFARVVYCYIMLIQFFQQGTKPIIWSRDPLQFHYTIAVLKKLGPDYNIDIDNLANYISSSSPCQLPPLRKSLLSSFFSKNPLSTYDTIVNKYAEKLKTFHPSHDTSITSLLSQQHSPMLSSQAIPSAPEAFFEAIPSTKM